MPHMDDDQIMLFGDEIAPLTHAQSHFDASIRSALSVGRGEEGWQPTHRHKKRGTEYTLIGVGQMQADSWIDEGRNAPVDMRKVAVYQSVDDGLLWVRPIEEFEDGRFEALSPHGRDV